VKKLILVWVLITQASIALSAPIAIGIFNNTSDTVTINNINLFPGTTFSNANLSATQQCSIYTMPLKFTDYTISTSSTLPIVINSGTSWRGGYACNVNNEYVSGIIDYTITSYGGGYTTEYVTNLFAVNNQNEISISFNYDGIKIFGQDPSQVPSCTAANNCGQPAKCSNNNPATDNGSCGCLNYPDSGTYTGSSCNLNWSENNPELPPLTPARIAQDCSALGGTYIAEGMGGARKDVLHAQGNVCCKNNINTISDISDLAKWQDETLADDCITQCYNFSDCGLVDIAANTCTCMNLVKNYN
jgi:hypothetical protein